jgi:hypothetical protein
MKQKKESWKLRMNLKVPTKFVDPDPLIVDAKGSLTKTK